MIANDNGPPDGDFVRYLEALVAASRTAAMAAQVLPPPSGTLPRGIVESISRKVVATSTPQVDARKAPMDRAAAEAMADALLSVRAGAAPSAAVGASWVMSAIGALLVVIGLFVQGFNFVMVIAGIALLSWSAKLRKRRQAPTPVIFPALSTTRVETFKPNPPRR